MTIEEQIDFLFVSSMKIACAVLAINLAFVSVIGVAFLLQALS